MRGLAADDGQEKNANATNDGEGQRRPKIPILFCIGCRIRHNNEPAEEVQRQEKKRCQRSIPAPKNQLVAGLCHSSALFFILIGLASSLPFLFSTRQHNRYIFQSYPFYVLALAFMTDCIADKIEGILKNKRPVQIGVLVIAAVFFTTAFASMLYKKDENKKRKPFYRDIYLQNIVLPERITISACPAGMIHDDWLFADMMRFYRVSLTPVMGNEYLLIAKDSGCEVPEGYQKIHRQPTMKYILYQRSPP